MANNGKSMYRFNAWLGSWKQIKAKISNWDLQRFLLENLHCIEIQFVSDNKLYKILTLHTWKQKLSKLRLIKVQLKNPRLAHTCQMQQHMPSFLTILRNFIWIEYEMSLKYLTINLCLVLCLRRPLCSILLQLQLRMAMSWVKFMQPC